MHYSSTSVRNVSGPIFRPAPLIVIACLLISFLPAQSSAQSYEKELSASGKALLTIRNPNGRVSVIASNSEKDKSTLLATSAGAAVEPSDVIVSGSEITVRARRPQDRIDLVIHVPARARVKVESATGMVDIVGDFEVADVLTDTGTIHADVPVEPLKFKFLWQSSRPRYLSDIELPRVKEGRAGAFSISGTAGPDAKKRKQKKKEQQPDATAETNGGQNDGPQNPAPSPDRPKKPELGQLNFTTQRGVIFLNVHPTSEPNQLLQAPLTTAPRAIFLTRASPPLAP